MRIIPLHTLAGMLRGWLTLACVYSGTEQEIGCETLVSVTSRLPNDRLWTDLQAVKHLWADAGLKSVQRIGDCFAPSLIAMAFQSGHHYARTTEFEIAPAPLREDYGHI